MTQRAGTSTLHHRLLAVGLIAGVCAAGVAVGPGSARAAGNAAVENAEGGTAAGASVTAGQRAAVAVSPSALPATVETGGTRRTTHVTLTL